MSLGADGEVRTRLGVLAARWENVPAAEAANAQMYIAELCDALDVPRPQPRGSGYEHELPIRVVNPDGSLTTKKADLFKEGCFLLEAKDEAAAESRDLLMRKAFGQARLYAAWVGRPPPYLLALDVGRTLMIWDRWSGSYGDFHAGRRISLASLADHPEEIALLRDIWTDPSVRDPRARAARVTREIAGQLGRLAASLERRGHDPEVVARYLMRCVFTMFAEDVGLLQDEPFTTALVRLRDDPADFASAMEELWAAMDEGRRFGLRRLLRFNGHFFKERAALPMVGDDLEVLLAAAAADWRDVEPAIFGTLLVRALDPKERHRLGAEYTPREYVERLVRPTVEDPIRARWTRVQAEVLQLRNRKRPDEKLALQRLREFHGWLRGLKFLDPAMGSGNFLYVTMAVVKRIELEVFRAIEEITGNPDLTLEEVQPDQFHGIEVKPWARELAELTLWIGYHQFWLEHHGGRTPQEPLLRDTGTFELRDAVLAWDEIVHDPERDRPDPTPRITHPVTGQLVPDPNARLAYLEYRGARAAEWPQADFIIGNPPYMGNKRMREAMGDGYVEAIRAAHPAVPETADYVMYWWNRAAKEVAAGRTERAGMITTNSIVQPFNREVVSRAMEAGTGVIWAAPDHPWVDEAEGAQVRVAMTVVARNGAESVRIRVNDRAEVLDKVVVARLNADLSTHADVAGATRTALLANRGMSLRGFSLVGRGFVLDRQEAEQLLLLEPRHSEIIRRFRNGRDLAAAPRDVFVIDFGMREEEDARQYPVLFDIVRDRVKPQRDSNNRESRRRYWWRFGEPNPQLRRAIAGLRRYVATGYVSRHRVFSFLDSDVAPDEKLVVVATDDPYNLGVLSARLHTEWALAAGTRLGVGNDPTYNNTLTFDPYPFPHPSTEQREKIARVAEQLDRHRKEAIARDERITVTGLYNVLEKLRAGDALTVAERHVHEMGAVGVLRDLHDNLDRLVAEAYGWPWPMERDEILTRLVELHGLRVREEERGIVRWLRPEYQVPRFGASKQEEPKVLELDPATTADRAERPAWPESTVEQIAALEALLRERPVTADEAAAAFRGTVRTHLIRHLETLVMMGEVVLDTEGRYMAPTRMSPAA
jgi:hypothetical protein